ncbi:serine hydrolase [Streptomyces sp. PT12]|uniref:serine hydrolase domain-containing protein n=1 Tax=Streptomyces sp. PT12 TaxID=1510197 RepID=UPI000DE4F63F|nr:serine hydrolase domain-containing protein [Streptomyces sp. PT12]RBM21934.1 hypothetical protein DEH69_05325 [Streptomyces sp. PT12]
MNSSPSPRVWATAGPPGFGTDRPGDPRDILDRFSSLPLRCTPGSTWHYSSPGYLLTAWIIERVSAQGYADSLTERVLRPLGTTSTCVGEAPSEPVAHGYRAGRRVDTAEFAALPGPGDLWSTVDDLALHTAAFNAGHLLTPRSREAMTAPHVPLDGAMAAGGCGYFLGTLTGHAARFHSGDNPVYQSFLAWPPHLDATVALLCNDEETHIEALLRQLIPAAMQG